ncbi:hypothetical protein ACHELI_004383 [Vibrio vulnificus]
MPKLKDGVSKKKPISVKINANLDARIKIVRAAARQQGKRFNMSEDIESYLEKLVKAAEKELGIDFKGGTLEIQSDLFEE